MVPSPLYKRERDILVFANEIDLHIFFSVKKEKIYPALCSSPTLLVPEEMLVHEAIHFITYSCNNRDDILKAIYYNYIEMYFC